MLEPNLASRYAESGFRVVELLPGKKQPESEGWSSLGAGIGDAHQIDRIIGQGCGIGLMHVDSRTCALDVDHIAKAELWLKERGVDLQALLNAPDAVRIRSGKPGHDKLLYRLPESTEPLPTKVPEGSGLELRCASSDGKNMQDVLPPSVHPDTGKPYEWVGDAENIPELPFDLERVWRDLLKPAKEHSSGDPVGAGGRNNYLTGFAGKCVAAGIDAHQLAIVVREENKQRCDPPLPNREVDGILRSAKGWTAAEPLLKPAYLDDVMTAPEEPTEWVIEGMLPRDVVTLLAGHGGIGKSFLALVIAVHVAVGVPFGDLPVRQGRVLFVSFEDSARTIRYRLRKIIEHYKFDAAAVFASLVVIDASEQFAPLMQAHGDQLKPTAVYSELQSQAQGFDLVIVDNASDAFDGNENVRRHVRFFMQQLAQIAREVHAAVLLLAHIDKATAKYGGHGENYSGSSGWHNSSRERFALVNVDNTVLLLHEKNNFGPLLPPAVVTTNSEGVPSLEVLPMQSDDRDCDDLLACFEEAEKLDKTIPERTTPGNGSAMQALAQLPSCPSRFKAGDGKKRLPVLINQLLFEEKIVVEEYRDNHRNPRKRLRLVRDGDAPEWEKHLLERV